MFNYRCYALNCLVTFDENKNSIFKRIPFMQTMHIFICVGVVKTHSVNKKAHLLTTLSLIRRRTVRSLDAIWHSYSPSSSSFTSLMSRSHLGWYPTWATCRRGSATTTRVPDVSGNELPSFRHTTLPNNVYKLKRCLNNINVVNNVDRSRVRAP